MPKARSFDVYSNRAMIHITMSAANTITFEQIRWAAGTFTNIAIILHEMHIFPSSATVRECVAATDLWTIGLTSRNDLTVLAASDQSIYGLVAEVGRAAVVAPWESPLVYSWAHLPEKGIIVPPNPMYLAMTSAGFAAAGEAHCILYYTFVQVSDKQSLEVLQTILPGNV